MQGVACYKKLAANVDVEDFVKQHSPLIHRIARYIQSTIPQYIEFDDLLQSGLVGLLEARAGFKEDGGASFSTYATLKIRFAIYEGIRKSSGITREISQNIKKISAVMRHFEQQGEHKPSVKSLADEIGVSVAKYAEMTKQIDTYQSINTHDNEMLLEARDDEKNNPINLVELDDTKANVKEVISELPKREQIILALYYNEQMNLKEIAGVMDLTEARVSQLHAQVIIKLKRKLTRSDEVLA